MHGSVLHPVGALRLMRTQLSSVFLSFSLSNEADGELKTIVVFRCCDSFVLKYDTFPQDQGSEGETL